MDDHAQGILYKNPSMQDASFFDLFEGDEIGNAANVNLAKVQMFFCTVIVAIAYCSALWHAMVMDDKSPLLTGTQFSFPQLTSGLIALLGINNGGYLGSKSVDHTKQN
jgi:hypothetical protein